MQLSEKKITIKDIARIAKVSPSTVSMVINGRAGVSEDTKAHVLQIIKAFNYTPNLVARSLIKRHSYSIAMLITHTMNPVFPELSGGVDLALKEKGYSLSIISTYDKYDLETKEIERAIARGIDGIIASAPLIDNEDLPKLADSGFPVVCALRRIYTSDSIDYVIVDSVKGAYLATEHLIRLGHIRIGIIGAPASTSSGVEKLNGVRMAFKDYDLSLPEELIHEGDYLKKSAYLATQKLLRMSANSRPTAIFAFNDAMAIGAFEAIWEAGLNIPEDIALVGFNNTEISSLSVISLTTVAHEIQKMGRLAAERLIAKIEKKNGHTKPYQILLEPKLKVRKTCGYTESTGYTLKKTTKSSI